MTNAIAATSGATSAYTAASTTTREQTLDGDAFLKLLMTQLTNQDPSSPMDTNEMMAQTTQLSMMEALVGINDSSQSALSLAQRQTAVAHIGHDIEYLTADGDTGTGTVVSVSSEAATGTSTLVLEDGTSVAIDQVTSVTSSS